MSTVLRSLSVWRPSAGHGEHGVALSALGVEAECRARPSAGHGEHGAAPSLGVDVPSGGERVEHVLSSLSRCGWQLWRRHSIGCPCHVIRLIGQIGAHKQSELTFA
eukprot:1193297-Prorocentrum_minimum.AAC.5